MTKRQHHNNWRIHWQRITSNIGQWLEEFSYFIKVVIKPIPILLTLLTVGIIYFAQSQNGNVRLIFEVVGMLSSSIIAGLITQSWMESRDDTNIIKKSGSAIRNLQLIKFKIKNISGRLIQVRSDENKRDFDEIDNLVGNIEKDILNSILDWADVNPSSEKLVDYYETLRLKEKRVRSLQNEKRLLKTQKNKLHKDKKKQIEILESKILDKNSQISKLETQITNQDLQSVNILSGVNTYDGSATGDSYVHMDTAIFENRCEICKKPLSLTDVATGAKLCSMCSLAKI